MGLLMVHHRSRGPATAHPAAGPRQEAAALPPQANGSSPHHRLSATPRGRCPAAAHAAAAVAPDAGPADSSAAGSHVLMNAWQGVSTLDSNSALMPMETGSWPSTLGW